MMSGIREKVVLITGASSGIGEATARVLAAKGAKVILGARRTDRLKTISDEIRAAGGSSEFAPLDVTSLASMQAFVEKARQAHGRIDVIVNNAGVMPASYLEELKVDEWNTTIDVNIRGVLHGIAAVLPIMKQQGSGQVINISSVGGHHPFPSAAVYCATKSAVLAISEGLRQETQQIRVTVISPGVTDSELFETISDPEARKALDEIRKTSLPAEAIAKAIAYAIEQPDGVDISEIIVRPTANSSKPIK